MPRPGTGCGVDKATLGNLGEKARLFVGVAGLAVDPAATGPGEVQLFHRPGQPDVEQPPLLLQLLRILVTAVDGEDPLLETDDEDQGEFQALGRVQGHQPHLRGIGVQRVAVRHQGDQVEELRQPLLLAGGLFELPGLGQQFFHVLQPVRPGDVEASDVFGEPGAVDDLFQQVGGPGPAFQQFGLFPQQLVQFGQRRGEPGLSGFALHRLGQGLTQGEAAGRGMLFQALHGLLANAAGRDIDDPLEVQVIPRVGHHAEVGHQVLDLLSFVEGESGNDLVRDAIGAQGVLQHPGLEVHAVEDRHLVQFESAAFLADDPGDHPCFLQVGIGADQPDGVPIAGGGPELLALALGVVVDHAPRRAENGAGGAVVLLQLDQLRAGEVALEVEDVAHLGTAPAVDRLVFVTHGADIAPGPGQQAHHFVLRAVGVLVLVHQQVAETLLVEFGQPRFLVEQPHGEQQQVVEVNRAAVGQPLLVFPEQLLLLVSQPVVEAGLVGVGGLQLVLGLAENGQHLARLEDLDVEAQALDDLLDQCLLVVGVIDLEVPPDAVRCAFDAQQPRAGRVEGGYPEAGKFVAQQLVHPRLHLRRGLVGEGDGQDLRGPGQFFQQQPGDAVGDHPGLSRTGAGQDQDRPFAVQYRLLLGRIQLFQEVGSVHRVCWYPLRLSAADQPGLYGII